MVEENEQKLAELTHKHDQKLAEMTQTNEKFLALLKEEHARQIADLKQQNSRLLDENETLQLEAIENDDKQKHAASTLENLLLKLQKAQQVS